MKRSTKWVAALAVVGILLPAGPALAEERTCRGTIGGGHGRQPARPAGRDVHAQRHTREGTVKVERAATLRARGVRVIGNVQAENARNVRGPRWLDGRRQRPDRPGRRRDGSSGAASKATSCSTSNREPSLANSNRVGGSLQAFQNTGGVTISEQPIDGNLQCKENEPPPTGGGNIVQGNKEDQCASL